MEVPPTFQGDEHLITNLGAGFIPLGLDASLCFLLDYHKIDTMITRALDIFDSIHLCVDIDSVISIITGKKDKTNDPTFSALRKLVVGPLDADKLDYLIRDAYFCGVPYGNVDIDRLIQTMRIMDDEISVTEKGIAHVESLMFARYLMFRCVYWHHTIRIIAAMLQRAVGIALNAGEFNPVRIFKSTEDELLTYVCRNNRAAELVQNIKDRKLHKRAKKWGRRELTGEQREKVNMLYYKREERYKLESKLKSRVESSLTGKSLRDDDILFDIPMLSIDIPGLDNLKVLIRDNPPKPFSDINVSQVINSLQQAYESVWKARIICVNNQKVIDCIRNICDTLPFLEY